MNDRQHPVARIGQFLLLLLFLQVQAQETTMLRSALRILILINGAVDLAKDETRTSRRPFEKGPPSACCVPSRCSPSRT